MVSTILQLLLALFELIPVLKTTWEQLVTLWINTQVDKMSKENREAIRKAVYEYDQRALEGIINERPGEASGLPGTNVRPPRVHNEE